MEQGPNRLFVHGSGEMISYKNLIFRGLRRRCPKCGQGRVFSGYLTLRDDCSDCGESLTGIRTDDAAPWATIMVVGHLVAPFVILAVQFGDFSTLALTLGFSALSLFFTAITLPAMKGVFVNLNWRFGIRYS